MSQKNNVNPDHYKVAGRDRQGEDVVHEREKQSLAEEQAGTDRRKGAQPPRPAPARRRRAARGGGAAEE